MDSLCSPQIVLAEDNSTDVWLVREEPWELEIHIELLVISGCGEVLTAPLTASSPPISWILSDVYFYRTYATILGRTPKIKPPTEQTRVGAASMASQAQSRSRRPAYISFKLATLIVSPLTFPVTVTLRLSFFLDFLSAAIALVFPASSKVKILVVHSGYSLC